MTTILAPAVLTMLAVGGTAWGQSVDFRNARWGMGREQVLAAEGTSPSKVATSGNELVMRYECAGFAGLDCRIVYIFAKDKLVRTKYVFQTEHANKNDFLEDFTKVDAFLAGALETPGLQRVSWQNDTYKSQPDYYGVAISLGHLQYSTQWKGPRTLVTHALTGENGALTHEIEYVSVDLEAWEDQVIHEQNAPDASPRTLRATTVP